MSIPGQLNINIGLPNEPTGSDSLRDAFIKTENNFSNLFSRASPFNNFVPGNGISIQANANAGNVVISSTGVTNIVAGNNIVIDQSNGNVTINAVGPGTGTVTSVGLLPVSNSRLVISNSPVTLSGNISVDLAEVGITPGTYTNPITTVDTYGRIVAIADGSGGGGNVDIIAGDGIVVTGANGNFNVAVANSLPNVTTVGTLNSLSVSVTYHSLVQTCL